MTACCSLENYLRRTECEIKDNSPTVAIPEAVDELEQTEMMEFPSLHESINPDALDRICQSLTHGCVDFVSDTQVRFATRMKSISTQRDIED